MILIHSVLVNNFFECIEMNFNEYPHYFIKRVLFFLEKHATIALSLLSNVLQPT
jgi:hypothetical protein